MSIRKSIAKVRYNRYIIKNEKHLFRTKLKAMQPQNWDIEKVKKLTELISEGGRDHKWSAMFEEDKPLTLRSFAPSAVKEKAVSESLRLRSNYAYKQRNEAWRNVFDFLPEEQIPDLAIEFIVGCTEVPEGEQPHPSAAVSTFSFPSVHDMPNPGDEYAYADYNTYDSVTETIKERMGLRDVYVESVGKFRPDGSEIQGTIGSLGFRIWWAPEDLHEKPLFNVDPCFTTSLPFRVKVITPIRKITGLDRTIFESRFITKTKECGGPFHVLVVASDVVTTKDYMQRADDIREALKVPGLVIAPFGKLDANQRIKPATFGTADENGIHHTAFIFYAGDEQNVIVDRVENNDDGSPLSVVSGFMPVHSSESLLWEWRKPVKPVAVTAT